ncbi:MAG: TonB-dependent receptor [Verrucomicrobiota bacterium]|nr:TonB-dependent receptor [Verrucomicrobiota bacterium]MCC6822995.1 TonB-dependent receptor [Limisphaerales bacterium]
MNEERLNTDQKALQINLDRAKYGTFAEIGAGQEVARWFFRVGGAAGTVAKTISAYDMTVSDAIYGSADRYVSRQRLQAMINYEYDLLIQRLDQPRGDKTAFFSFANTVATRSFTRNEEGHGWLGIRFQAQPRQRPCEIIIHVRLLDAETVREQEAIGIVGVNLIHAAYYRHTSPVNLIGSLMEGLTRQRIEVDMIRFSGPAFAGVDNRLMALQLVEQGLTDAAMFTAEGESVIPSEMLYKKPVLVERGGFRPLTNPMLDMLDRAHDQFMQEKALAGETPVTLMEMTLRQLQVGDVIDHGDFLDRVDMLGALKKPVLISNFRRYHRLVHYLSRHTQKMIGLPLGLARLRDILDEKFYTDLDGGLLESLGQLLRSGVKLYVYPWLNRETGKIVTLDTMEVAPNLRHLYAHLVENHFIEDIRNFNAEYLAITTTGVIEKLQAGDAIWESQVPGSVAEVIKAKKLFGGR